MGQYMSYLTNTNNYNENVDSNSNINSSKWSLNCNIELWANINKSDDFHLYNCDGIEKIKSDDFDELMVRLLNKNIIDYSIIYTLLDDIQLNSDTTISMYNKLNNIYDKQLCTSFINMKKNKKYIFECEENTSLSKFKSDLIHPSKPKLYVFNHSKKTGEYVTHDEIKHISYDIGGVTNVSKTQIKLWEKEQNITYITINNLNLDEKVSEILRQINILNDYNLWGLSYFIKSLLDSYTVFPENGIKIGFTHVVSPDDCFIIKNSSITHLINNDKDRQIFIDGLNTLSYFNDSKLTIDDVFRYNESINKTKMDGLTKFYSNYTVVGNYKWCNSNINKSNINYEYTLPEKHNYISNNLLNTK
jgi:hypothetical protein